MRVKRGIKARHRRNRLFKLTSGFRGRANNTIRQATYKLGKALRYAYRGRKERKREFRQLWIARIGAACRQNDISYSVFMNGLKKADIQLDRKVLADLGALQPEAFTAIVNQARAHVQ